VVAVGEGIAAAAMAKSSPTGARKVLRMMRSGSGMGSSSSTGIARPDLTVSGWWAP
jgi:hypothetical protein